jgi:PleD family two-component response regulator
MATARGGALRLASTLGAGTTVTLELPAAPGLPEVAAGRAPAPRGRRERVLLVDDEPAVRRAMAHVLADDGYQVRDVGDPVEAVALFAARA